MIESHNDIWEKYEQARKLGAPTNKLDDDMVEYFESKYVNDAKSLEIQKKLFFVNDYRHITIDQAATSLPFPAYQKRLLYDVWVLTINEDYILKTTIEKMHDDFYKYVKENGTKDLPGMVSRQNNEGANQANS